MRVRWQDVSTRAYDQSERLLNMKYLIIKKQWKDGPHNRQETIRQAVYGYPNKKDMRALIAATQAAYARCYQWAKVTVIEERVASA